MMTRRELLAGLVAAGVAPSTTHGGYGMMREIENIKVLFIAGFGPIVRDSLASRKLYKEALDIPFKEENGGYLHTEALEGDKSFALWPLSQAAQSCFGKDTRPEEIPVPQAWLEFDVDSIAKASTQLESRGYRMLIKNRKEPWGQTVTRFLSPEGLLIGITFTPWMRKEK
jgi:Glyoxalase-like domain